MQRLLIRFDSRRCATGVSPKTWPASWEPFAPLLHHVATALLKYSPSSTNTADTETAEGAAGKKKNRFLVL